MKKVLKTLGYLFGGLTLLIVITLSYFYFKGIPSYTYAPPAELLNLKVAPDSMRLARGAAIGAMHCIQCHAGPDGKLTGKPIDDLPPMFGQLYSLNITKDSIHGIGEWTDGELYYFLRTGIHKDGRWSPPFMPKFSLLADEDLYSVIAWLRSDDARLAPDSREYPPNHYNLFNKVLANTLFGPPPMPEQPIVVPDTTDKVIFGRYVANNLANCYVCHSGDILKVDDLVPERSAGFYGGGSELRTPEGKAIFPANLTMDRETGIGNLSVQEFLDAVRFGKRPGGGTLSRPMAPHSMLSEMEVKAIYQYLQTVPVIKNQKNIQASVK